MKLGKGKVMLNLSLEILVTVALVKAESEVPGGRVEQAGLSASVLGKPESV